MPADKSFRLLVSLLRLAVSDDNVPMSVSVTPTADEWRGAYRHAARHAVIALAWDGVAYLQTKAQEMLCHLPAELTGKWFADVQTIQTANERMAQQAARIQAFLKTGGFRSCVLKGASLAAYYPRPAHRQAADIDLWVQAGPDVSLAAHRRALLDYLRQSDVAVGEVVYHHIATVIDSTEVEMHVTPTWLYNPCHNRRLQQLFARTEVLTPQLQELYSLLHAFRHIYHDGLSLRHVLDYMLVCRSNRASGICAPVTVYAQLGLSTFADTMNELVECLFLHPDITQCRRLSRRASHLLAALPQRLVSATVKADYPSETLCALPWRTVHLLWRRRWAGCTS